MADVPLAPLSTIGVGGAARWFVRVSTLEAVAAAQAWASERGLETTVWGGGSNVVVADEGYPGLVMQMAIRGLAQEPLAEGMRVWAGAGESWDAVVRRSTEIGCSGIECLSGIPGTVGGTPIQNVGAYGQEVADTIRAVIAYDRRVDDMVTLSRAACLFSYRSSRFKTRDTGRFVICGVALDLSLGPASVRYPDLLAELQARGLDATRPRDVRTAVLAVRARKGMVVDPADADSRSVGSFFVNPIIEGPALEVVTRAAGAVPPTYPAPDGRVKVPAAWLIERAGFRRGDGDGRVGLSDKHTLAIVNRGGGTAAEVVAFAAAIKRRVIDRFGVWLRPEPVFLGFGDAPELVFLQSSEN